MNADEPQSHEIAPLSPYYVPGPEELEQAPLSPKYVPELVYPKYLASLDDDIPIEYQPLPADASLTALSPSYIADLDPLEDQEEDPEDGPKEDPADYPIDGGDKEEEESSRDDADDEDEEKAFEETKDTEAFETDESAPTPPSPRLRMARISVRPQTLMVAATEALIDVVAAALPSSSPLPSPLTPLPQIPSPPLPLPSPPLPLPAPSSPLLLHATDHKEDVPEADVSLQKRLCLTASTPRFKVGENATPRRPMTREVGYRIMDVLDDMVWDIEKIALTTLEVVNQRVADIATTLGQDTQAMYARRAWASSKDRSTTIEARVRGLETHVATLMAHTSSLQIQLTATLRRIQILEAREPVRTDDPKDADSKNASKENHHPYVRCRHKALVTLSVADALAEQEANKSRNGDERHDSGTGSRRTKRVTRERMFLEVSNTVEKYVCGLSDMIQGGVMASKPKTMQDAIEFAIELMDQKIRTFADCQAKNKRKLDENIRNNQNQQQTFKKQNVSRAYTTGPGEKKVSPAANANANNQETSRQIRGLSIALSVEFRGITRKTARSCKTRIKKIKPGMKKSHTKYYYFFSLGLGEYSFGGAYEKSATILLTYAV
nr:hypothetical protein [Tanacetum cinerariifolium]